MEISSRPLWIDLVSYPSYVWMFRYIYIYHVKYYFLNLLVTQLNYAKIQFDFLFYQFSETEYRFWA